MIRAAAKNFAFAAVVVKPGELRRGARGAARRRRQLSLQTREILAAEAFAYTARYDTAIARWFAEKQDDFPRADDARLREGHRPPVRREPAPARGVLLAGRRAHARALDGPPARRQGAVVQQRARPQRRPAAGAASSRSRRARSSSTTTRAGWPWAARRSRPTAGVRVRPAVGLRRRHLPQPAVDAELAEALSEQFCEVVFAPGVQRRRARVLSTKPNLRILDDGERRRVNIAECDLKRVMGGLLVQDRDLDLEDRSEMQVVTERKPSEAEWGEMLFAWKVCKHVRSNAIVLSQRPRLGRDRRGADEPRRLGPARDRQGARDRLRPASAARWRRTRSSRSRTARSSRSTPASRRSSSRAARCATTRWSKPPTPPASRWSSPAAGTSGTSAVQTRVQMWSACRSTARRSAWGSRPNERFR